MAWKVARSGRSGRGEVSVDFSIDWRKGVWERKRHGWAKEWPSQ